MTRRWLVCLVVGLATPVVHAQTAPVTAPDSEYTEEVDVAPMAPSPPPALPPETPSARPFPDAVWTSGHWYWDGDQWRFKPGAWVARMPGYQFINGYWQQDGDVWLWISGGWARLGSTEVEIPIDVTSEQVATSQPPPQLQVETPPPPPDPNLTWAPGYWYWSGSQWNWIEGTWVAPPQPGLVLVAPRWVRRGPWWVFLDGGWAVRGSVRVVIPEYRHAGIAVRWGHPNHFFHSWRHYPGVRPHYYRRWSGPGWHHRRRHHDASPYRDDHRGGRWGDRGGRWGDRGDHGGGWDGRWGGRHHR